MSFPPVPASNKIPQPIGTPSVGEIPQVSQVSPLELEWTASGTGTVTSVTATDTSIVVSGTDTVAPTIATGTLDVIATQHPPAANWSNNSKKITSLANGAAASDAMAFGQLPQSPGPAVNGLIAWSWDIMINGTNSTAVTGGTLYLTMFTLWTPATLNNIWWINTNTPATPTSGQNQVGIYNSSGTLVASATTSATATAMVGTNAIEVALSSSYAAPAGNYWVGMVFQAATLPNILKAATNNGNYQNLGVSGASLRTCVNGTSITTALPSSITPSSNTASGTEGYWVGVS